MKDSNRKAMFADKNKNLASKALFSKFSNNEGKLVLSRIPKDSSVRIIDMKKYHNSPEQSEFQVEAVQSPTYHRGSRHTQLGIFKTLQQARKFVGYNADPDGSY